MPTSTQIKYQASKLQCRHFVNFENESLEFSTVSFTYPDFTSRASGELHRAAAKWLDHHQEYTLLTVLYENFKSPTFYIFLERSKPAVEKIAGG
jgi:hypothetical protein